MHKLNLERLNTYRKGLKVERLHTVTHITPYNNGFHSANAALLSHELCELNSIDSRSVVLYMLMHDVAEGYVGDMPSNFKRDYPSVKMELDQAEKEWESLNLPFLPTLTPEEKDIVKIADLAELGFYALEELALGNTNLNHVLVNVVDYMQEFRMYVGVNNLIDHFVSRGNL